MKNKIFNKEAAVINVLVESEKMHLDVTRKYSDGVDFHSDVILSHFLLMYLEHLTLIPGERFSFDDFQLAVKNAIISLHEFGLDKPEEINKVLENDLPKHTNLTRALDLTKALENPFFLGLN
jgi:hypothetical protein